MGSGDYHLTSISAAIDTGTDAGVVIDFDGNRRPRGLGYDIGADEWGKLVFLPLVMRND